LTSELFFSDATELAERIRTKDVSPVEVVEAHLDRTDSVNPVINAIVVPNESALDQARVAEQAVLNGDPLGPLHGVPFSVKEVFDTEGIRSTRGSLLYADRVPETDAAAVRRLKEAGAIVIGKTNCPEFALAAETVNDLFGRTLNPWNLDRTSGGSSGGEAAAISAGLSPLGIGTDLGGSNRLPSHYCNVVGYKPTHGLIPLTGSWPEIMSRRMHVGPIARSVRDIAMSLVVMSGLDHIDPYALGRGVDDMPWFGASLPPLRVGMMTEGPFEPVMDEIQAVVREVGAALESLGCIVEEVSFDWHDRLPIAFTMDILIVEADHYFKPFVEGREDELSGSISVLLNLPKPSMTDYLASMDKHESVSRDVTTFFADHDLLLLPTSPVTAPPHDSAVLDVSGRTADAGHAANITATFGMTGHPAISVPFGMSPDGLPIGVQLAAGHLNDRLLLHAAATLEAMSETATLRPPLD
jgi:aspartyl-tRNA(Asn)/glutamyl-tRNA(Gln) amidotransferase subunit A